MNSWQKVTDRLVEPKNRIKVIEKGDTISVRYELVNAKYPNQSANISGTVELTGTRSGDFALTNLDRDEYPSMEIYQDRRSSNGSYTRTLLRQKERSIFHLTPMYPKAPDPSDRMEMAPTPFDGGTYQPGMIV